MSARLHVCMYACMHIIQIHDWLLDWYALCMDIGMDMHCSGRNRFGSIRFGSGLFFEDSSVRCGSRGSEGEGGRERRWKREEVGGREGFGRLQGRQELAGDGGL